MTETRAFPWEKSLGLRPGELVEVRSKDEILATLNENGRLDGMPFMPEMLQFCGRRFRVFKRAEKSCDTVLEGIGRRVYDTVHLEGVRCDGSAHGGCQATCLIWWREAWLKRVSDSASRHDAHDGDAAADLGTPRCTEEDLAALTRLKGMISGTIYSCQLTRLLEFTYGLRWFDPRPVVREVRSGNVGLKKALSVVFKAGMNILRRRFGRTPEPHVTGRRDGKTPAGNIPGLKPGDWVVVKSKEEIEQTLNQENRNRGLFFDIEMLPYCGRRMRLLKKVDRIIDDRTGGMRGLPNDCWIIEGAVCTGYQSRNRLFCTRRIYPFWREIWFRKAEDVPGGEDTQVDEAASDRAAGRSTSSESGAD